MDWKILLGLAGLGGLALVASASKKKGQPVEDEKPKFVDTPQNSEIEKDEGEHEPPVQAPQQNPDAAVDTLAPGTGTPPAAMIAGDPKDPEIAALLQELQDFLASSGAPLTYASAQEITTLPKGNLYSGRRAVAIPPRELWANMVPTLKLFSEIRKQLGAPISIRAYRPPDYNKAVGGKPRSIHQWFSAMDLYPPAGRHKDLALIAASHYYSAPKMGFNVYGTTSAPTDTHIDTGWHRRVWGNGQYWVDKAAQA